MSNIAIRVENIAKKYQVGKSQEAYQTFGNALLSTMTTPIRRVRSVLRGEGASARQEDFWALRDISFEVKEGETVGIIGRNGAGKSTLLKVLSRITEPSAGYIDVYGRVGALLEVGTGFHPELTGRENIFLNGAILGMSRRDIERKFDEIVDFSGVGKFVDTPVKHYSSGMGLRLGFAVAAYLEPDILIVDEVLAVGDSEFQRKCLGKMQDVSQSGRTVLFVSHNMAAVRSLCSRAIMLRQGKTVFDGDTDATISHYLAAAQVNVEGDTIAPDTQRDGSGVVRFDAIRICNRQDEPISVLTTGQDVIFELDYHHIQKDVNMGTLFFFIHFNTLMGERLFACSSRYAYNGDTPPTTGTMRCAVPNLPLVPGMYSIDITCKVDKEIYDTISGVKTLQVAEGDYYGTGKIPPASSGNMLVAQDWSFVPVSAR